MLKCMLWKEHHHCRCRVTSPHRCHPPHIRAKPWTIKNAGQWQDKTFLVVAASF